MQVEDNAGAAALPAATGIDSRYYQEGARWEKSVYGSIAVSRAAWRVVAIALGIALLAAVVVLFATLITDLTYAVVDPRIRYE